jgi:hypothetical protein
MQMTNRFSARIVRGVVFLGLATALIGTLAATAYADGHDNRDRKHDESRRDDRRPVEVYRQPDVYYSAPPVVYAPPGASLNFSFPLYR